MGERMKLQFDAYQDYQLEAIQAVVSLFAGQPDASQSGVAMADEGLSSLALSETGVANQRVLTDAQWLANLNAVQALHGIETSAALETLTLDDSTPAGVFPNFTVETAPTAPPHAPLPAWCCLDAVRAVVCVTPGFAGCLLLATRKITGHRTTPCLMALWLLCGKAGSVPGETSSKMD